MAQPLYAVTLAFLQAIASRPHEERELLVRAFYAETALHGSQRRKDGRPYAVHPLEVALILAESGADTPTLAAALLHDVLEDTPATPESLAAAFGPEIVRLVRGVTRTAGHSHAQFAAQLYAEGMRDGRIASLKVADRCANLLHGSQLALSAKSHHANLLETEEAYLELASLPSVPPDLRSLLAAALADSWQEYRHRLAQPSLTHPHDAAVSPG